MIDLTTVGWMDLIWIVVAFAMAMWMLASSLTGFEKNKLKPFERYARAIAGIAVLRPNMAIAIPALAVCAGLITQHRRLKGTPSKVELTRSTWSKRTHIVIWEDTKCAH